MVPPYAGYAGWQERCSRAYAPRRFTLAIPTTAGHLPGLLAQREAGDTPVAYICSGNRCSPPITTLEALEEELVGTEISGL